jgi:hypothetical protein
MFIGVMVLEAGKSQSMALLSGGGFLLYHMVECVPCETECSGSLGFLFLFSFLFFAVLGLELRAFILSHSTSPFSVMGFLR